jgi:hypothetical protein
MPIYLYLDDRRPCPPGWTLAVNVDQAKQILENNDVELASLDHDLGACPDCNAEVCRRTGIANPDAAWLEASAFQQMPNCEHVGSGYTLVCWMEQTGIKPKQKPNVHSANASGAARMRQVLDKLY